MVPGLENPLVFRASQNINQIGNAETLTRSENAGKGFLDGDSSIPGVRWIQAGVAIAAGLLKLVPELTQQHLTPATGDLTKTQHRIQLLPFHALEMIVTL